LNIKLCIGVSFVCATFASVILSAFGAIGL
jgi:hypothetical protein